MGWACHPLSPLETTMSAPIPWYRSLAWKFFYRSAVTLLALSLCLIWVVRDQSQKRSKESAEAGIMASSKIMEQSLANQIRVMDAGLEVFTTYNKNMVGIEQQDFMAVRDALLENLAGFKSDVAMVIRPSGALLSCTTDGYKQDYADVGIVEQAMHPRVDDGAESSAGSYPGYFGIDGGTYQGTYLGVARRLRGKNGEFLGVMVAATRLGDSVARQLRDQTLARVRSDDPASHVALIAEQKVLGSTLESEKENLSAWLNTPLAEGALRGLTSGARPQPIPITLNGVGHLALFVPMAGTGAASQGLTKLITIPVAPYLRPFQTIERTVWWVGLSGLLLAVLVALKASRTITAPLHQLTVAVQAMADGGQPEFEVPKRRDEVGALTEGFRMLLSELKAKEELLCALEDLRSDTSSVPLDTPSGGMVPDRDKTLRVSSGTPTGQTEASGVASNPSRKLKVGDLFADRYRIERVLGTGGMGVVLKAHDRQLDEDVALKVIRPELGNDPTYLETLKQEIKLARRISHRNVLRTHDFGEAEGIPFVSMEYLKGVSLRELLDEKVFLPLPLVLRIGRQVAEGLEAAHGEGVVHRDVKPQNVMFDNRGEVKLMDFGLAAPVSGRGVESDGAIFGTPRYMAPEQFRGEPVDPRTDIYALGVMLFELSTGFPPFPGEDSVQLAGMHLQTPVPDAKGLNRALPDAFSLLLKVLMSKAKQDRPSNVREVIHLLRQVATGDGDA